MAYQNKPKGFIFDLDGTLVTSDLDFVKMRDAVGCPEGQDILTFVDQIADDNQRKLAHLSIVQMELDDALTATWIRGAQAFVEQLARYDIPMAIVTRNCRVATSMKITNNQIPINTIITREDAPSKPNPTALTSIANEWAIAPQQIAYVGDYLYDIQAANRARMQAWSFGYQVQESGLDDQIDKYFDCFTQLLLADCIEC